jgi:hypothetical protein
MDNNIAICEGCFGDINDGEDFNPKKDRCKNILCWICNRVIKDEIIYYYPLNRIPSRLNKVIISK